MPTSKDGDKFNIWLISFGPAGSKSTYLHCKKRQKWLFPRRNNQVGDLVLIANANLPRNNWPLGLVVSAYPGSDAFVRSVTVKLNLACLQDQSINFVCLRANCYKNNSMDI